MSGRLSWRRLGVLVRQLPRDSATVRAAVGPDAEWDLGALLLAHVADLLAAANWQRQGKKSAKRPDLIPRPGVKATGRKRIGSASYTPAELRRVLDEWPEEVESSP